MKTLLFKPFEKYQEKQLLIVGIAATIMGVSLAHILGGRFDGALDFHLGNPVSIQQSLLDSSINIFCLISLLFLAAKYLNKKTRIIDLVTTVLIARIPLYFLPLLTIGGAVEKATNNLLKGIGPENIGNIQGNIPTESLMIIMVFVIASLLLLVWSIALMYNGYKIATNAKGNKPILIFVLALLLAEIMSKTLLFL